MIYQYFTKYCYGAKEIYCEVNYKLKIDQPAEATRQALLAGN